MPKVSVIIPVFNAEKYIERCLNSVCNQTLKDIEIICVDDCSDDNSPQILEKYAAKYSNLQIISHAKNQGESVARNSGLSLAKGEYLGFVDNDDEIDLNFYEKLYEKAVNTNSDIIKGQAIEITYDGHKNIVKQIPENANKLLFLTYWWTAIYRRSLIIENNISFSVSHALGGDLLFLNQAMICAEDLQLVDGVYYHYYRREDSGDSKILSEEKIRSALNIYERIIDNINSNISPDSFSYNFIFHHFIMGCFYLSLKNDDKKIKQTCAKITADIFEKCQDKDGLQSYFTNTTSHLFILLKNKDIEGIKDILIKSKTRMELMVSGLRARIKSRDKK